MPIDVVIRGSSLPGRRCVTAGEPHENLHVGVQKQKEVVDLRPGDAQTVEWQISFDVVSGKDGTDFKGPYVQGKKGDRFLYLSWGSLGEGGAFKMFRRAKLMLEAIDVNVLAAARKSGRLIGELGLTMPDATPLCAAVRPPRIKWRAE